MSIFSHVILIILILYWTQTKSTMFPLWCAFAISHKTNNNHSKIYWSVQTPCRCKWFGENGSAAFIKQQCWKLLCYRILVQRKIDCSPHNHRTATAKLHLPGLHLSHFTTIHSPYESHSREGVQHSRNSSFHTSPIPLETVQFCIVMCTLCTQPTDSASVLTLQSNIEIHWRLYCVQTGSQISALTCQS